VPGRRHASPAGGEHNERPQALRCRLGLGHQPARPGAGEGGGIGGLVIVGGMGIGQQDRRPSGGGEFGDRRGAAARDDEMGDGEPLGDIGEEIGELRRLSEGGIGAAHLLQILGPALLGDGDPPALVITGPATIGSGGTLTRSFCSVIMVLSFDSTGRQRPFGHRYPSRKRMKILYWRSVS
jgi:hypothetical protein